MRNFQEVLCSLTKPPAPDSFSVGDGGDDAVRAAAVPADVRESRFCSLRVPAPPCRPLGASAGQAARGDGAVPRLSDNTLRASVKCLFVYKGTVFEGTGISSAVSPLQRAGQRVLGQQGVLRPAVGAVVPPGGLLPALGSADGGRRTCRLSKIFPGCRLHVSALIGGGVIKKLYYIKFSNFGDFFAIEC